jgi:two-component system, NarL family, response regulator DesR
MMTEHLTIPVSEATGTAVTLQGLRKSFGEVTAVDGVDLVVAGLRVVDPGLAAETLAAGESPLTPRERDVLVAARGGGTVADVAKVLFLSDGTVRNYLSSAIGKTGARTRAEAARVAEQNGWL